MSPSVQCPIHLYGCYFDDRPPFKHNIRLESYEKFDPLPKINHAYIYSITHVGTGMRYIGQTMQRLSGRWAGHRSDMKAASNSLYRAMKEYGLHMFVMEKLEECGDSIKDKRELDYMREFDSWNPLHGYNNPKSETRYARKLYFLLNPAQEIKYWSLCNDLEAISNGWRQPTHHDQKLREELKQIANSSLQEGRVLMRRISSLASPVILASLPPEQHFERAS